MVAVPLTRMIMPLIRQRLLALGLAIPAVFMVMPVLAIFSMWPMIGLVIICYLMMIMDSMLPSGKLAHPGP